MKVNKKILSFILVISLIASQLISAITVSADAGRTPTIYNDFSTETYMAAGTDWQYANAMIRNITDETLVLYSDQSYGTGQACFMPANSDGTGYQSWITEGSTYRFLVKYKYKSTSGMVANIRFAFQSVYSGLGTRGGASEYFEISSAAGNADDTTWYNACYVTSITAEKTGTYWLGMTVNLNTSWKGIWLDDIEIYPVGEDETISTITLKDGDEVIDSFMGFAGDAANIAPLEKEGAVFEGWYTDSEFNNKFTNIHPENDTILYAKWQTGRTPIIYNDFSTETYMATDTDWQYANAAVRSVTDGALDVHANQSYGTGQACFMPANSDGTGYQSWMTEGSTYRFLVRYKYKSSPGMIANIAFSLQKNNELWTRGGNSEYFEISSAAGNADGTNWYEACYLVSIDATATGLYHLAMVINLNTSWQHIYIDDLEIYKVDDTDNKVSTITLQDDEEVVETLTGFVGDEVEIPTPEKVGYDFLGWYTDAEFKNEFSDTVYPGVDTILYAKWKKQTGAILTNTFENKYDDGMNYSIGMNANGAYSVEEGIGYENSKGIEVSSTKDYALLDWRITNDDGSQPMYNNLALNDTRKIMVKYKYKCEGTGSRGIEIRFMFKHGYDWQSCNAGDTLFNISSAIGNADGEWHEVSYTTTITMSNSAVVGKNVRIGMQVYLKNANNSICLDDIEVYDVTETPASTLYFTEKSNGLYFDPVAGYVGETFDITDTVYDCTYDAGLGLAFDGYYTNEECTEKWDGKFQETDTSLYAYYAPVDGYKSVTENFERYTSETINNNFAETTATHGSVTIEEENGNKVLRYTVKPDVERKINFNVNYVINNSDGTGLDQALSKGNTYYALLTYKYKIAAAYDNYGVVLKPILLDDTFSRLAIDTSKSLRFGNATVSAFSNPYLDNVKDGEWHTATVSVCFTPDSDIFADFGFQFDAGTRNCDVYFDDISLTVLPVGTKASTICVKTDNSPVKFDFIAGEVGADAKIGDTNLIDLMPSDIYKRASKFVGYKINELDFVGKIPEVDGTVAPVYEAYTSAYDYNFDNLIDIRDLVKLKKNSINADFGMIDAAMHLVELRKILLEVIPEDATVGSNTYTLAFSEEFTTFDSSIWTKENSSTYSYVNGQVYKNIIDANHINVVDGKAQFSYDKETTSEVVNVYSYVDSNLNTVYAYNPTSEEISSKSMTLVKENASVINTYGASINTVGKLEHKYGYIEAKVKFPKKGVDASLWLNKVAGPDVKYNEIDIFETFGNDYAISNIHSWDNEYKNANGIPAKNDPNYIYYHNDWRANEFLNTEDCILLSDIDSCEWHIVGFEWNSDFVKMYVDGECYLTITKTENNATYFEYFANYALYMSLGSTPIENVNGWDEETTLNSNYEIDYIRIYQNTDCVLKIK